MSEQGDVFASLDAPSPRRGSLLRLTDGLGRVGLGEASPLAGYSPDGSSEVRAALERFVGRPLAAPGEDPLPRARELARDFGDLPAARFAVESAWLDLAGKRLGVPLARLLGSAARTRVPLAALVTAADPAGAAEEARAGLERGIGTLKLKIGLADLGLDLARGRAVRDAVGSSVALRLDANGRLAGSGLAPTLAALAELEPELLEEPVPTTELLAARPGGPLLVDLAASPIRLALDESLHLNGSRERLLPLLAAGIFRAVVLKPTCLGLLGALDLAAIAEKAGASVIVTHAFDGPVARAAAAALALAVPGEVLACGLDRHAGLDAWPPVETPSFEDAALVATDQPGVGIDPGALA